MAGSAERKGGGLVDPTGRCKVVEQDAAARRIAAAESKRVITWR